MLTDPRYNGFSRHRFKTWTQTPNCPLYTFVLFWGFSLFFLEILVSTKGKKKSWFNIVSNADCYVLLMGKGRGGFRNGWDFR